MSDWRTLPLEDALDRLIDYRGKSPPKSLSGIPVISAKVVKAGRITAPIEQKIAPSFYPQWMTRGLPKAGDVVLTTEGPLGEVAQLDHQTARYALGQRVVCLQPKHGVLDGTFLKFLLMSPALQSRLSGFATGTTVAGISQKALRSVPITIPPFANQVMIGKVAGALDDKVELNRRMNETLEAMARAIFQDWFVAFGPTRAKMEGRPPYLAPDLWALFPDSLDAEGKPEGWASETLAKVADLNPESWSSRTMPSTIEYLDLSGCESGEIQELQTLAREGAPSRAQRILRPGDTAVGTVRPGNRSFALIGRDGVTGSTGFAVLRPKHAGYREFLYLAATADDSIAFLAHRADGAAYPAVRPDVVAGLPSVWAGHSELLAFSSLVAPLIDSVLANRAEAQTLAATRDLLLPRLMSGELRVRDAERLVETAA